MLCLFQSKRDIGSLETSRRYRAAISSLGTFGEEKGVKFTAQHLAIPFGTKSSPVSCLLFFKLLNVVCWFFLPFIALAQVSPPSKSCPLPPVLPRKSFMGWLGGANVARPTPWLFHLGSFIIFLFFSKWKISRFFFVFFSWWRIILQVSFMVFSKRFSNF